LWNVSGELVPARTTTVTVTRSFPRLRSSAFPAFVSGKRTGFDPPAATLILAPPTRSGARLV
jgi:hypothetical protein